MHTPMTVLAVYCLVSLELKENYPFSHYPMYSNPGADRSYYILSDAAAPGPPSADFAGADITEKRRQELGWIPVADATGGNLTCPKVGKMFRTKSQVLADKLKMKHGEMTPAHRQEVGAEIFRQVRHYARERNTESLLPARMKLEKVDVSFRGGEISEIPVVLATE